MKNPVLDWLSDGNSRARERLALALAVWLLLAISTVQSAQAQTYRVLFQFRSGAGGANPNAGLVSDSSGNLYGTTASDGAFDSGVVFELNSNGKESVLHSFTGTGGDGQYPLAGLVRDADGNLYGTTYNGGIYGGVCGSSGCGTVFKVDANGKETRLHRFSGTPDGWLPYAGLVRDAAGNLYGVTLNGGTYNSGTVFKINKNGKESVLYSFNGSDGQGPNSPWGGLIRDAAGNLYGTTGNGGTFFGGAVFKLDTSGTFTVLYNFDTQNGDGYFPAGNLVRDAAGNLYGTTEFGGTSSSGTVFKVDASGNENVLHNFAGGTADGGLPFLSGLLRDAKGNLYGVTDEGGAFSFGTVYKLDPAGKETILHSFNGKDGKIPYGTLIMDQQGNLYGTTNGGGAHNAGVVFEITP
jgi:uncharacterized repeat protein (TIGR03803 family)